MAKKRTFKEIRLRVQEIINRQPTQEQLEDLRKTFIEVEKAEKDPEYIVPTKKIAHYPEVEI